MSGGIFPGYPFTLNIKCIIFALIIMALYSFKAPQVSLRVNIIIYLPLGFLLNEIYSKND
jgi:hypothetical protein